MTLLRFGGGALLVLPFLARRGGLRNLDGLGWRRGVGLSLVGGPLFGLVVYSGFALAPRAHPAVRSEGRRVGKACRSRGAPYH